MVWVQIHHDSTGPWNMRQLMHVHELHDSLCGCPACKGAGIHDLRGA
jgi:hypothetical protein